MVTAKEKETETAVASGGGLPGDADYVPDLYRDLNFEPAFEDSGDQIDWEQHGSKTPFFGMYTGYQVKIAESKATKQDEEVKLLLFIDANGERCCTFANWALTEAFGPVGEDKIKPNSKVKIIHHGLTELDGGSQTFNRMSVYVAA